MNEIKLKLPETLKPFAFDDLTDEFDEVMGGLSQNEVCRDFSLRAGEIYSTVFENLTLSEARLKFIGFNDVLFKNCRFEELFFEDSSFSKVRFENCKFSAVKIERCPLKSVLFKDCDARYLSLIESGLTAVRFDCSRFPDAYLYNCRLKNTEFSDCDLTRLENENTRLYNLDFSSCKLKGMRVRVEDLKGCTLSATDALGLIAALGIKIK